MTFANGAITGPRGHPIALYEDTLRETYYAKRVGTLPRGWFEGQSYHVVSSAADLESLWPRFLAMKPDFIKIILGIRKITSVAWQIRLRRSAAASPRRWARAVVERAHRENMRVVAHVRSAGDFRAALDAGVDQMAHFPVNNLRSAAEEQRFTLTPLDATRAARAGVVVTPTASLNQSQQRDPSRVALVRQYQAANLKLLKAAGVKIAVGTQRRGHGSR